MENRKILDYHFKSANSSPNSSVDRQERNITRGTGIHLSSATRERLWARTSATTGPSTAAGGQNGVTSGPGVTHNSRPRRLSGSTNHYICDSNGYRNTENTSTFYYSPASQKSADSAAKMRYANSLESLDAVSTSIQQARAQSQPMHHHQYHQEPTKTTKLSRNEYQPASLNYAVPGCQGNFQRTFPLRKSGKEDVSETYDIRHVLPTTSKTSTEAAANWKSSASTDRLSSQTTSALDPFWTPSRTRRSMNKATHINGGGGATTTGDSAEIHRLERELQEEKERVQRLSAQLTTNAHVVSAFEHSLSNMTSRLEQLNLTSNRKDRELQELRHIINNLKEKNEMGDQTVPSRWKSDDNMLNTQNEAYDINGHKVTRSGSARSFIRGRKNSWFRSSLTKAFGKNKSSGNLSNGCHDLPDPTPPPVDNDQENINNLVKHRSISTSALDESMIEDLQRQLNAKDDLLTETRLEALSSASQLQALREQVAKLRNELKIVRQENQDLRGKMNAFTHSTPIKSPKKVKKDQNLSESSLLLESASLNDFDEVLDIPVVLVVTALPTPMEIRIGSIRIRKNERFCDTKPWTDLDMNISCLFGLYLARLDPFECLGLNEKSSIDSYEFLGRIRKVLGHFDFVNDELSNEDLGQYVATQTRIILKLKILDELCFSALRPIMVLKPFLENQNHTLWISGPPGSGKTFLAKRMAEFFLKQKRRSPLSEDFVAILNFKPDEQYIGSFFDKMSLRAKIVIVDDVLNNEIFETVLVPKIQNSKIQFILVSDEKCYNPDWLQFNMRSNDRLESSFLGFLLRRRVLSIETMSMKANDSMIIAVNWLNRMHTLLVEFCDKNHLQMPTMKYFLVKDAPLENITQFRLWFVDLWNLVLIEAFREQLSHGIHEQVEDPTKIIARTWPWKEHELEKSLRPLNVNTEDPDSILNKDPLMDMLMCLQEATSK